MPKNEVATKAENEVMDPTVAALLAQYGADEQDDISQDDVITPRIAMLQLLSPQVDKSEAKYIDGAEAGMIFENVGNTLYDGEAGITFIPVYYKQSHIEWGEGRGKLVAVHDDYDYKTCTKNDKGKMVNSEGNTVEDTREWYGVMLTEDGGLQPAIISMASTQIKRSRQLMSQLQQTRAPGSKQRAPFYFSVYNFATVPDKTDKGKFFSWKIERTGFTYNQENAAEILEFCHQFFDQVKGGEVKSNVDSGETGEVSDGEF